MNLADITQAVADAAAADDSVTVNTLLESWTSTEKDSPSMRPFQAALYNALRVGHLDMARNLLRRGCKVDPGTRSFC